MVTSAPLVLHGPEVKWLLLGHKRGILERGAASSSWLPPSKEGSLQVSWGGSSTDMGTPRGRAPAPFSALWHQNRVSTLAGEQQTLHAALPVLHGATEPFAEAV